MLSSSILKQILTLRSGWTVAVALALLVASGVVKPVRATGTFTRQVWEKFPGLRPWLHPRVEVPVQVDHLAVELYRRPSRWRRLLSFALGAGLSALVGCVLALVVGAAAIWFVGSLTGRLK
ncbi:unannotated protein [freshwater metagenome]|uniref:Unannotated protein n=1 Tax=freshwater metagenome TaxID=449393 RepID=A0A6J7UT77_9ZZZZ|nr:hypothetical protein [Actinomycetota bacterium]